jgi:flagellar biogenesis protein FliO
MGGGGGLMSLARTLIGLIGVCALAWFTLSFLARRGSFGAARTGSRLKLLERLALGPRRALYLVQADSRVFLLGAGDAGQVSLITELESPLTAAGPGGSSPGVPSPSR